MSTQELKYWKKITQFTKELYIHNSFANDELHNAVRHFHDYNSVDPIYSQLDVLIILINAGSISSHTRKQ